MSRSPASGPDGGETADGHRPDADHSASTPDALGSALRELLAAAERGDPAFASVRADGVLLDLLLDADPADRPRVVSRVSDRAPAYADRVRQLARALDVAPRADFLGRPAAETFAAHVADPALAPGDAVGDYRVVRELGRGGMGVVYLAERPDVGLRAALKVLSGPVADAGLDPDAERFLQERRHLAALAHPGVARLLDAGRTDDGRPYFAMELVAGEPVTAYADRRRLGLRDRAGLFVQLCEAVRHVHGRGLVHGDVKPDNVLVADDDEGRPVAKLVDFGVAARWRNGTAPPLPDRPFTYAYTAPEVVAGGEPTPASDVFALGVVLHDLLGGAPPRGELDRRLRSVSDRATHPAVGHRPATVVDLLAEVRVALSPPRARPEPPVLSAPTLLSIAVGAALAVAVVARAAARG